MRAAWLVGSLYALLSFTSPGYLFSQAGGPCPMGDYSVAQFEQLPEEKQIELLESYREPFSEVLEEAQSSLDSQIEATTILIEARLKTIESLEEKILRPEKDDSCFSEVTDIVGIRLIIPDYAALPYAESLVGRSFQIVSEENSLLAERKSGYRAVHYLVSVEGKIAEIQLQTLRGLLWADVSHNLFYKGPFRDNPGLKQYLHELSDAIYLLDSGFSAAVPEPPATLPEMAKDALEETIDQIRKVGRPNQDMRFLVLEHDEDESGHNVIHLRLTVPLVFPSDYCSLDEFHEFGFQIPASRP